MEVSWNPIDFMEHPEEERTDDTKTRQLMSEPTTVEHEHDFVILNEAPDLAEM